MSIMVVRLDQADQTIDLDSSPQGFKDVYLHQWKAQGLAVGEPTLFLEFQHQDFNQVWGNVGNRVPLLFTASRTNPGGSLLPLAGKIAWSDCKRIRFKITNFDYSPATFTTLDLVMKVTPPRPVPMVATDLELVLRQY